MSRLFIFAYSLAAYAFFLAVFLYLIAFVANVAVPRSVDIGPHADTAQAFVVDALLIALFGLQHTLMARPAFKRWLERAVPPAMERSTYVWISSVTLAFVMWQWQPIPATVWQTGGAVAITLWSVFGLGWGIALLSTFLISHFDLFGLRQAYMHLIDRPLPPLAFSSSLFYRLVRHPLMLGFLIAFWFTPHMTVGHLLFATGMTLYILVGVHYEERDLVHSLGPAYEDYRRRTPAFFPGFKGAGKNVVAKTAADPPTAQ